jgi:hypothetical protein
LTPKIVVLPVVLGFIALISWIAIFPYSIFTGGATSTLNTLRAGGSIIILGVDVVLALVAMIITCASKGNSDTD